MFMKVFRATFLKKRHLENVYLGNHVIHVSVHRAGTGRRHTRFLTVDSLGRGTKKNEKFEDFT